MRQELSEQESNEFFTEFFCGKHNIPKTIRRTGSGWSVVISRYLATVDVNDLTRLVFLAHEKGIRVEILAKESLKLQIMIHKRDKGSNDGIMGHPSIETALENWKKRKKYTE